MIAKLIPDFSEKKAALKIDLAVIKDLKVSKEAKRLYAETAIRKHNEWEVGMKKACNGLYINTDRFTFNK